MLLLFLMSGAAFAFPVRQVYVSPTGVDAPNRGDANQPFRSINYAVMNPPTNLGNGDTLIVNVAPGFYNENVDVPDGWPSMQLSCSVAPGRAKLIIKGPNALYINGRFQGVSPVTNMAGRVVNQEALVQQASAGRPAFRIGEGTDVEIFGLTINNANHQAIVFDAGTKKPYLCQNFANQFAPQFDCVPASIKLRHNIFQTSGTQTGNAGGDFDVNGNFDRTLGGEGIVGIKNNKGVNPVNGKRATFIFEDNLVRNIAGYDDPNDPNDDPLSLRRVGVFIQNSEDTVRIMNNRFEGNSQTLLPGGGRPLANAIMLFGVRGTSAQHIIVQKNRIEDTYHSGIRILSADTLEACAGLPDCFRPNDFPNKQLGLPVHLTNRWVNVSFNSISKTNAANANTFGGVELTFANPEPGTPDPDGDVTCRNEWLFQTDNVFDACKVNAIVYNGGRTYRKRSFFANRNIFNKTVLGGGPGRGVFNNFQDPTLLNPDDLTVVEATGNWWGDNRGADHVVVGNSDYNSAPGNQIATHGFISDVGIYYSPWLAGYGTNGTTSPDDVSDDRMNPTTWGFQDNLPKTWIAKELLDRVDIDNLAPNDQRTPPGYHVVSPDMVPTRDLSDLLRDLAVTGYISRAVSHSKSNDSINVLRGTYAESVTINKDLYIYGHQRGVSASCNSTRRISDDNPYNDKSLPITNYPNDPLRNESKVTAFRLAAETPQGSVIPFYISSDVKVTLDGLAIYSGTTGAIIKDDRITTTKDLTFKNLIVSTIDRADVANTSLGRSVTGGFEGGAIVDIARHNGKLWINDNRFENIAGRFNFDNFSPSVTAVLLEGVNGSSWITRNYFQGNIEEISYDFVGGVASETRIPMGNAITVFASHPTGADSINVERNYIFRPDFSAIAVIDTANLGYVNNLNVRYNTIDQANVGAYFIGLKNVRGINLGIDEVTPNDQQGGITMRFGNSMTNNIAVQFNNIKNTRFASINLVQQNPNTPFSVPSNFRVVYNLFDTRNGQTVLINTVDGVPPGIPSIQYTYNGTFAGFMARKEMGISCTWAGAGNVNARGNWWGSIEGPIHDFNINGDGLGVDPRDQLKVHYSPWVSANTTPDDGADIGPRWDNNFVNNNNAPESGPYIDLLRGLNKSNYNMDCSSWGYQDRLQKTYYVEISSPGLSECQPQVAINMMKDGDILNVGDVTSFFNEDLVINKNIVLDAPGVNVSAKVRDIIVLNGKKVSMRQHFTARNIYLACNVNVPANTCQNLYTAYPGMGNLTGPVLANGYIETWSNPAFIKYLDFTGTVCEEPDPMGTNPDRYVRGYLRTKRRVRAGQGETFGNMGYELTAGVDNLDSVTVNRMAGPDTLQNRSNPTFDHIVKNGETSINRSWAIKSINPYNAGDRRVIVNWYRKEDNGNDLRYARPWNKNSTLTNGEWYGLQPSTLSPEVNPRRVVIDGLEKWRLMDTLTIAENVCNIVASISKPMPSLICEQGTINFNIMIKGGQPPYMVTVRENTLTPVVLGPFNGTPDVNGMYTFPVTFNTQGPGPLNFYTITEVKDQTGCRELVNVGSAQTIDVRPIPTARLVGDPQPVCNGNEAEFIVDFSAGTGPWRVGYRIGNDPTVQYVTTTQDPFNLRVVPTNNSSRQDQVVAIKLESVDYGPGTCVGSIVDAPSRDVTVRPAPTVTFGAIAANTAIKACQCESPTVDVLLEGKGPWQVQYSIRTKDGLAPPTTGVVTLGNQNDPTDIPVLRTFEINPRTINLFSCPADTFYVKLDRVIDGNGCATVPATNPEAQLIWTPLPTVQFANNTPSNFCKGTAVSVPVVVTGQGPWTISYLRPNGTVGTRQIGTPTFVTSATLDLPLDGTIDGANVFSIIGVQDGGNCSNNAINSNTIVNINPLPAVGWTTTGQTICQGGVARLEVQLKGMGPWIVNYTVNGAPQSVTLGNPGEMGPIKKDFIVTPSATSNYCLTSVIDGNLPACTGTFDSQQCFRVQVNPAPTASFLNVTRSICAGQQVPVNVFLRGIGPWTITYTANGNVQTAQVLGTVNSNSGGSIHTFNVAPLTTTTYSLLTVTDNTSPTPCTASVVGSSFTVTVNEQPTAVFAIPGPIQTCQGSLTRVPFNVSGRGPWVVSYTMTNQQGNVVNRVVSYGNTFSPSPATFNIEENININSQICITRVQDGSGCFVNSNPNQSCINVLVGQAVSAAISGTITTACQGQPVPVTVTFAGGAGPFNFSYRVGSEPVTTVNGLNGPVAVINVTPTAVGTITVTPVSVALLNGNCTGSVAGVATITVQPRPTATITSTGGTVCSGSNFSVGLQLTGRGPWKVYYTRNSVPDSVILGDVTSPGTFPAVWVTNPTVNTCYALTGVRDGNGCLNTASGEICVNVTPTPRARFADAGPLSSCNGSPVCLNVALEGIGPWNVTLLAGVTPQTFTIGSAGQVGTPGNPTTACINVQPLFPTTYTIIGVTDNSGGACPGVVTGNPITVNVSTLPTANITNVGPVPTICLGQTANVVVNLTGAGPFNVTLVETNTGSTVTANNVSNQAVIPVTPSVAGSVVYRVQSISYSNGSCTVNSPNINITGTALVNVNASATATVTAVNPNVCSGGTANAVITFTGNGPFNFTYTVNNQSFTNTTSNNTFPISFQTSQVGNNTVAVTALSNNTSCPGVITGAPAVFNVTQGPTAVMSGTIQNVCVGTAINLSVTLSGVGPFQFTYQEAPNGPTQTISFATAGVNNFTAVPTAVGTRTFRALSVTDASGCVNGSATGEVSANVGTAQNLTVLAVKTDPTCAGGNGSITITAFVTPSCQPGACPLEYSLDGINWQVSNIFADVMPGTYTPYSRIRNTSCPATGTAVTVNAGPVVSSLNITNITVNSANVAWANSAQGPFRVRYRITGGTSWTTIDNITNRNVNLTGLQNNTNYDVEWYSLCGGNVVGPVTATFRTLTGGGCAIVGGVFIDDVAPGTATVNWNGVPSAVCYIVQWKPTTSSLWQTASVNAGQTSFTATNLTGACTWEFRIRTNCTSCDPNSGTRSAFTSRFNTNLPNVGCRTDVVDNAVADAAISEFSVYPNPNNGIFNIRFNTAEEGAASVTMFDLEGKEIVNRQETAIEGSNSIDVDLSGITAGIYLLKVQKGGSVLTTKVVIN